MNGGPVEEGAKIAVGVVEALRAQPLALALIVMNVVFVVFFWSIFTQLNTRTTHQYEVKDDLIVKLITQCKSNQQSQQLP
jgi:hypothetical protein